jgi:hypothetical protein
MPVMDLTDSSSNGGDLPEECDALSSSASDADVKKKVPTRPGGRRDHAELRLKLQTQCVCAKKRSGSKRWQWSRTQERGSCFDHFLRNGWESLVQWRDAFTILHKLDQDRLVPMFDVLVVTRSLLLCHVSAEEVKHLC